MVRPWNKDELFQAKDTLTLPEDLISLEVDQEVLRPINYRYYCSDCGRTLTRDEMPYHNADHSIRKISEYQTKSR